MRAVAGRKPAPVLKTAYGEGAAEERIAGVINRAWPVLDAHASSELAREMIRARDTEGLIRGMPWQDFIGALGGVTDPMATQVGRAVASGARDLGPATAKLTFLNTDAVSVKFAQQQSGKLIAAITDSQREAIRTVMGAALNGAYTVDQAAAMLRGTIGLHPAWAEAVVKYQTSQYTRLVKDGMAPARAATRSEAMGLRYRNRLVKRRAETIARTEIQTASNLGRYATWAQMIGSGAARPNSQKEWSPGPGACNRCEALSGQMVAWDRPFSNGAMMPPAHPNCRCTANLIPAFYADSSLNAQPIDWLNPLSGTSDLADTLYPAADAAAGAETADMYRAPTPEPMTEDEAAAFFNTKTVTGTESDRQVAGLYKAGMDWNTYLRGGITPNEYIQENIDTLTGLIDKQPQFGAPVTVYRGLPITKVPDLKPGTIFKDEGFMSTTLDPKTASNFAGTGTSKTGYTPILQIATRSTDRGLPMSVINPADMWNPAARDVLRGEAEIILRPGTALRVVSVEEGRLGGWTHLIVKAEIVDG